MKRILCLILCGVLFAAALSGCGKKENYSFAPIEDTSAVTAKKRDELNRYLREAGKAPDGVSFYAYRAVYNEDGVLEVSGFVRNRTGNTVYNIEGTVTVRQGKKVVAKAYFLMNEEQFGRLENKDNRPWTLRYPECLVKQKNAALNKYTVEADFDYVEVHS